MVSSVYSTVELEDGAIMAYEVLGSSHLGSRLPIVLIGGMSSRRCDWERLSISLAQQRPVLIFDHRGMGDSTLSPSNRELINIESLARDLLYLLKHLQWKELAMCGFSMGGVVTQQLLFLPYHATNPTPLSFRVTHVLLTATLCSVLRDKRYGLRIDFTTSATPHTEEEKKLVARPTLESLFDPQWVANPANKERFEVLLNTQTTGRPLKVILQQGRALNRFDFTGLHDKLPGELQVLVIHGEIDGVVPFLCGEEILRRIPWAKTVEIGTGPGQVPSLAFGHNWFEYFDISVWRDVVRILLGDVKAPEINARL